MAFLAKVEEPMVRYVNDVSGLNGHPGPIVYNSVRIEPNNQLKSFGELRDDLVVKARTPIPPIEQSNQKRKSAYYKYVAYFKVSMYHSLKPLFLSIKPL